MRGRVKEEEGEGRRGKGAREEEGGRKREKGRGRERSILFMIAFA